MIKDRIALDLPHYDGLLASHHQMPEGHVSKRLRGTDDWVLVATLSGRGRIATSVGEMVISPRSLLLITPGVPHDYGTAKDADEWEILWVHFHPPSGWLELLQWPTVASGISLFEPENWDEILPAFGEVIRLSTVVGGRRREFGMNALERLLLFCEAGLPGSRAPLDDRVRRAIDYIHAHLREELSLDRLSAEASLSPSRFSHLFRDEVGLPPLQYVSVQRLERAQMLLGRTSLTIGEIAAEVGMEPFHFSARFKAHTGASPREYRTRLHAAEASV